MKRCPECRRDYYDETLLYCLDDGNSLLDGPATADEPKTAILHNTGGDSRPATIAGIHTTDVTQHLPTGMLGRKRRSRIPVVVIASIVVLAVIGGGAWYLIPRTSPRAGANMELSKLVTGLKGIPGNVGISPDAKYVVYSLFENGKEGLWLKQVSQDASIPIVAPAENAGYTGTAFARDGELIYFVRSNRSTDPRGSLYSVPILGGKEPRKIKEHVNSRISLSPDGSEFVFVRYFLETEETAVMIAKTDGTGEDRRIASRTGKDWFDGVAWSPDGRSIACATGTTNGGLSSSIAVIPASGGEPIALGTARFGGQVSSIRWLPDGSGLLLTAPTTPTAKSAVWQVSFPGGLAEKVTKDLNAYFGADISRDGNTAVMAYGDWYSRVWVVGSDGIAKKITNGRDDGVGGVAYLNDGRIVYTVNSNDEQNLWVINADGSDAKAITTGNTGAWITPYIASPDGRSIVFSSYLPDNISHTWRVNVDGSGLKQLSTSENYSPMYFRDGKSILFARQEGTAGFWKMPADGGDGVRLSDTLIASNPAGMSADGKYVACSVTDTTSNPPRRRSALVDLETGKLVEYIEMPVSAGVANLSPDGKQFVYIDSRSGVGNLWVRPVSGGPARQVTNFSEAFIERFAPAPDGKSFVVKHSEGTNEIVLARNFR